MLIKFCLNSYLTDKSNFLLHVVYPRIVTTTWGKQARERPFNYYGEIGSCEADKKLRFSMVAHALIENYNCLLFYRAKVLVHLKGEFPSILT